MPRATRSSWWRIRAVAPQIVSSSSSKKKIGRGRPSTCQTSSRNVSARVSSASGTHMMPLDLGCRWPQHRRSTRRVPTTGTMKLRLTMVEIGSRRPPTCTADGSSATSSCGLAQRRPSNVSPSSTRPPGKLISPRWLLSVLRAPGQQHLGAVRAVGDRRRARPTDAQGVDGGHVGIERAARAATAATTSARCHRRAHARPTGPRRRAPARRARDALVATAAPLRTTQRGSSHCRPAGRARSPGRPSSGWPAPCPGGCSPRSHSSHAVCSLWRSGGGGTNDMAVRLPTIAQRWSTHGVDAIADQRPAIRPTSVLRPPSGGDLQAT